MITFVLCDFALLLIFSLFGLYLSSYQIISLLLSALIYLLLKYLTDFKIPNDYKFYYKYLSAGLVLIGIRGGLIDIFLPVFAQIQVLAVLPAVCANALVGIFIRKFAFSSFCLLTLGITLLIFKVIFLGEVELLPEEGYYWNYSIHPALGYIDHPPMVGWLIKLGTYLFGVNEFGARFVSLIFGVLTAFVLALTHFNIFGKNGLILTLGLVLTLPYFCGSSFFVSPDSGLALFWSLSIFSLYQALIKGKKNFWYWAGIFIGFGLLSKYTIILLILSAVIFCLLDQQSRGWFKQKEPYLALFLTLIVFLPVIIWNVLNKFSSFSFQSTQRFAKDYEFYLHGIVFDMNLLVLPSVLIAIFLLCKVFINKDFLSLKLNEETRGFLFALLHFIVPCAVFLLYSLKGQTKLNWTGPTFISILPWIGYYLSDAKFFYRAQLLKLHITFALIFLVLTSISFQYLSFGIPLVPYGGWTNRILGWRAVAKEVWQEAKSIEITDNQKPIIAGMDKHFISSNLSFYLDSFDPSENLWAGYIFASRNITGKDALMWDIWSDPSKLVGKTILMVAKNESNLTDDKLKNFFNDLSDIRTITLTTRGKPTRTYYSRVGRGYKGITTE